jgi:hypothetical protein
MSATADALAPDCGQPRLPLGHSGEIGSVMAGVLSGTMPGRVMTQKAHISINKAFQLIVGVE